MRILVIEDEIELLRSIARGLTLAGYAVDQAYDGQRGLQMALEAPYDLLVLDLNLPGVDGLTILRTLHAEQPQTKVLILSANSQLETKLDGFSLGASDYMTKPFQFAELEARIRVLLSRKFIQRDPVLSYQGLSLNTWDRKVHYQDQELVLTAKETSILEYFPLSPGRLITQTELLDHVWNGDADPFSNSIRVHMSSLRKKLKAACGHDPIQTRIGEGYMLC